MRRGSLRHFSSHGRRSSIDWDTALGFVVVAILINFLGLYLTHRALIASFEPYEAPKPKPEPLGFSYLEPSEIGEPIPVTDDGEGQRPDNADNEGALDEPEEIGASEREPANQRQTEEPDEPEAEGRPDAAGAGEDRGAAEDQGSEADEQLGPSDDDLVVAPDGELPASGDATGGRYGKPDPLAKLGGSTSILDQTFGPPPQRDHARDDDKGVSSVLDNREQLYRSFFSRIRGRIKEHWNPQGVVDRTDPTGSKYGTSPRTTVVKAHVDSNGKVIKLLLLKPSGYPELDEEALRTINAASPFPNPPSGLFDERGYADIDFAFTVTADGQHRFYRYGGR